MTDIETRLREVDLVEPPLGFDPDEVADRAAKQTRRRTAGITGTLAAGAVVAAVAVFAPSTPAPVPPAGPPTPPSLAEQSRVRQALANAFAGLFPGLRGLTVGASTADTVGPDRISATATFADAAGQPGTFQLTVRGKRLPWDAGALGRACAASPCDTAPDGSVLVIREAPIPGGARGFDGGLYRPDGSAVTITDAGASAPGVTDVLRLTREQVAKVITDPAFTLP
ncbi:hypothetical protein VA596_31175 [Amycolatopsis sp., V23-08]|uniref:Uncharacterized protein n=1 Tax=Amycolatopsis heterodermiae TaxID=3110235 RepID=A0ABU5RCP9_9PSEU|nr:hypothetical protein [Amycolatopsis sp., V23-08]MEA5364032.1 hypothetical protein [Amycolatopsis sp., V23-08]